MTTAVLDRSASPEVADELRAGALAMAPVVAAYIPFGLVVGATVAASANPPAAWAGIWLIFGGAAHVAVLDVAAQGSWLTAAAVGLSINARLAAYAAAMAPAWRRTSRWQRLAAATLLTDAPWALSRERGYQPAYFFGAGLTLFVTWPILVTAGMLVGERLSDEPVAGLLLPLTLGAVVVPQLRQKPAAAAVLTAVVVAVVTRDADAGTALLTAGAAGAVAGLIASRAS